jgi:Na+/H+ antiporter NhaD/arsenite permease-like protein
MQDRRWRMAIGPGYAILVVVGFLISPKVGIAVAIVGALVTSLLWTMSSGPRGTFGEADYAAGRKRNRRRYRLR